MTPVSSWNKVAYTGEELVCILLDTYQPEQMCLSPPINISHNVSFLVDTKNLQHDPDVRKIISKLYGGLNFDGIFSYTDKTFLRLKNPSIEQILNKNFEQKNRGPQPKS